MEILTIGGFSTQFHRTTEICRFSMDENLLRLQRMLHGKAREAVKALLILPRCVDQIMETLYHRFGRDEFVIKNLIRQTSLLPMPRDNQPQSIIDFATIV